MSISRGSPTPGVHRAQHPLNAMCWARTGTYAQWSGRHRTLRSTEPLIVAVPPAVSTVQKSHQSGRRPLTVFEHVFGLRLCRESSIFSPGSWKHIDLFLGVICVGAESPVRSSKP